MKTAPRSLESLTKTELLTCLRHVQARRAAYEAIQGLLEARLASLMSSPAQRQDDELLTADEVAGRLKLSRPRVYELVRQGRLPKVQFGKQIRIPSRALDTDAAIHHGRVG